MSTPAHDPITPGEILAEDFLIPLGISQYRLAQATGLSQTHISQIIKGKRRITPDAGLRIARALGVSDRYWIDLQTNYDTAADGAAVEDVSGRRMVGDPGGEGGLGQVGGQQVGELQPPHGPPAHRRMHPGQIGPVAGHRRRQRPTQTGGRGVRTEGDAFVVERLHRVQQLGCHPGQGGVQHGVPRTPARQSPHAAAATPRSPRHPIHGRPADTGRRSGHVTRSSPPTSQNGGIPPTV